MIFHILVTMVVYFLYLTSLILVQYTITALGRGEYPKLSIPLGLFPSGWIFTDSEGRNCLIIPNKQLKYTV